MSHAEPSGPAKTTRERRCDVTPFERAAVTFDTRLHAAGAPIADRLRPGATDAHIDAVTAGLGLSFPDELRAWYRWHDGVVEDEDEWATFGNGHQPLTLDDAAADYADIVATRAQIEAAIPGPFRYRRTWWPVTHFQHVSYIVADTASAGGSCDVHTLWLRVDKSGDWDTVRAGSLTEMLKVWTDAIGRGWWRWEPDGRLSDEPVDLPNFVYANELLFD